MSETIKKAAAGATRSKTIRFAAAVAALSALQVGLPEIRESIPPEWYGFIGLGIAVVVAVLRVYTDKALTER